MPYLVIWDFKHADPQARVKFWRWMKGNAGPKSSEWKLVFNSVIHTNRPGVAEKIAQQLKKLGAKVGIVEGRMKVT